MCGITGFLNFNGFDNKDRVIRQLKRMTDIISHRGPDGEGYYTNNKLAMGMRRLSIIDIQGGNQPIYNEDCSIVTVYNGEIYNYVELKKNLIMKGHIFKTESDTETIVHLYEEYGESFVNFLNGMFAIAIWDTNKETLLLYRDRLGVKPLYYNFHKDYFSFASEIKSLLQLDWIKREVNIKSMDALLTYNYCPSELTMFKGIYKVMPGSYIKIKQDMFKTYKYWGIPCPNMEEHRSENDIIEEMNTLLEDAVRIRLRSDVPLGAFLSGGIDSSTVVGIMSKIMGCSVKTFSMGFTDIRFNELPYANSVADTFKTDHYTKIVDFDVVNLLPKTIWYSDNPHGDVSFLPMYMLSQLARQFVTVVLTGDGGDEIFGGYEKYTDFFTNEHKLTGKSREEKYINFQAVFSDSEKRNLYSSSVRKQLLDYNPNSYFYNIISEYKHRDFMDRMLYSDVRLLLEGNNLVKTDRMGMAHSIEPRGPFLDYRLVEFVLKLPSYYKLHNGEKKYILKRALEGFLSPEIIYRRKQMFTVPIGEWFKTELREFILKILLDQRTIERGYFDSLKIKNIIENHISGRFNYTRQIRLLLILELWHRIFIDNMYSEVPSVESLGIKVTL